MLPPLKVSNHWIWHHCVVPSSILAIHHYRDALAAQICTKIELFLCLFRSVLHRHRIIRIKKYLTLRFFRLFPLWTCVGTFKALTAICKLGLYPPRLRYEKENSFVGNVISCKSAAADFALCKSSQCWRNRRSGFEISPWQCFVDGYSL